MPRFERTRKKPILLKEFLLRVVLFRDFLFDRKNFTIESIKVRTERDHLISEIFDPRRHIIERCLIGFGLQNFFRIVHHLPRHIGHIGLKFLCTQKVFQTAFEILFTIHVALIIAQLILQNVTGRSLDSRLQPPRYVCEM